jgi:hypothetical protein
MRDGYGEVFTLEKVKSLLAVITFKKSLFDRNSGIPILHATNSQSIITEYIRPRSIQGLDTGDRHSLPIEIVHE